MKYSYKINIVCNTQVTLDAVLAVLPASDDARIDTGLYEAPVQGVNEDGNNALTGEFFFLLEADRDTVREDVEDITGVLAGCEVPTIIDHLDSTHKLEGGHVNADSECVSTVQYRVVA